MHTDPRRALGFAALVTLLASSASALPFSNLYVFGDSIVDAGNTQALLIGMGQADPVPASAGYFDGRFTNGINPADVVNLAVEGVNLEHSLAGGDNFAYGAARARDNGDSIPDLEAQVAQFSAAVGGVADPNALYLINVGGNDVFDILFGADPTAVVDGVVAALSTSFATLQGLGAQHFLFVGVGDVGAAPAVPAAFEAAGRQASIALNDAIQGVLPSGALYFDTIGLFDQAILDPTAFGLPANIDLDEDCLSSGVPDPDGPPTCNHFAFFDTIHPTTQVLQILGDALVASVPEPSIALLLAAGLAGLVVRSTQPKRPG